VDTSRFASFHVTNISFQKRQALGKHPHLLSSRVSSVLQSWLTASDRPWRSQ
jgi:hypothetical protein